MRADPGPVETLLELRAIAADRAKAVLARTLDGLRAEEAGLEALIAAREALRRRTEEAFRAPAGGAAAGLRAAARFRERLRASGSSLDEAVLAQRGRAEEASQRCAAARRDLAGAEARREAVAARLRSWLAARRAAREAAEDEERDGVALFRSGARLESRVSGGRTGPCPARTRGGACGPSDPGAPDRRRA